MIHLFVIYAILEMYASSHTLIIFYLQVFKPISKYMVRDLFSWWMIQCFLNKEYLNFFIEEAHHVTSSFCKT